MSEHKATIEWTRETPEFTFSTYNRDHDWRFDSGTIVRASATPTYKGNENCVDPEEAFVASLSGCHMLTFLALACKQKLVVDSYRDDAVGVLGKDDRGRLAITTVTLRPQVKFGGEAQPSPDELQTLHHQAHEQCFIASSVRSEVVVEPVEAG